MFASNAARTDVGADGQAGDQAVGLLGATLRIPYVSWERGVERFRWVSEDLPNSPLPHVQGELVLDDARLAPAYAGHALVAAGLCSFAAVPTGDGSLWVGSKAIGAFDGGTLTLLRQWAQTLERMSIDHASVYRRVVTTTAAPSAYLRGETLFVNAQLEALTGYAQSELNELGHWFEHLYGEDAVTMRAMYEHDRDHAPGLRRVSTIRRKDGSDRMVELSTRCDGEHELWLLTDVTERVASQERFRVLFEQSSTALSLYDDTGFIDCNPAAVALLGYRTRGEVLGKKADELSPTMQPDGTRSTERLRRFETIALTQGSHRFDWVYRRADGSNAHVEVTLTPLSLGERRVLLAEWHDISERIRYEEGLEEARDSALAFARARSDFLATMSHEIRTPMNGVIGMTRLLAETPLTPTQREYVETVRACGEGLLALINDILDFSRLESGKVRLERIPFSVREVAEDAALVLAPQAHGKGLELCCHVKPGVGALVWGDPTRLRQVLLNLLSNAVKFTASGTVTLEVSALPDGIVFHIKDSGIGISADALPRLFSAFSQEDSSTTRRFGGSGLGLAICKGLTQLMGGVIDVTSSPQGSVFTVALPLENHTEDTQQVTFAGEGVLLVEERSETRRILTSQLRRMGLRVVTVEAFADIALVDQSAPDAPAAVQRLSAAGKKVGFLRHFDGTRDEVGGAAFVMPSPVRERALERELTQALLARPVPASTPTPLPRSHFAAKVLVAEDNLVNQRVVRGLLEKLGCAVEVVSDGRRAVEIVKRQTFDVVFMDCQMPELDGLEASRIIRESNLRLPIVALTAGVMEGDRERCIDAGMNDFLSKPVRLEDLERALQAWAGDTQCTSKNPLPGREERALFRRKA